MVLQGQPCGRVGRCRGFEGPLARAGFHLFVFGGACDNHRRMRLATFVVAAALVAGCGGKKGDEPAKPSPAELVARGAYLAGLGGCAACHTAIGPTGPDTAHAYAGGLEMPDAFGTWRTPNITQDTAPGSAAGPTIRSSAAIREGVRPDGTQLYPIMPYLNYNRLTDDDAQGARRVPAHDPAGRAAVAPNKDSRCRRSRRPIPSNEPDFDGRPRSSTASTSRTSCCAATATRRPDRTARRSLTRTYRGRPRVRAADARHRHALRGQPHVRSRDRDRQVDGSPDRRGAQDDDPAGRQVIQGPMQFLSPAGARSTIPTSRPWRRSSTSSRRSRTPCRPPPSSRRPADGVSGDRA